MPSQPKLTGKALIIAMAQASRAYVDELAANMPELERALVNNPSGASVVDLTTAGR